MSVDVTDSARTAELRMALLAPGGHRADAGDRAGVGKSWAAPLRPGTGLEDRTSGRDLDACHTTGKERHQPLAVTAPQDAGVCAQHLDDLIDNRVLVDQVRILMGQVRVIAAEESGAQLDSSHARKVDPLRHTPPTDRGARIPDRGSVATACA